MPLRLRFPNHGRLRLRFGVLLCAFQRSAVYVPPHRFCSGRWGILFAVKNTLSLFSDRVFVLERGENQSRRSRPPSR